jgi:hypothetical protein
MAPSIREYRVGRKVLIDLGEIWTPGVVCRRMRPKLTKVFVVKPALGVHANRELLVHWKHLRLDLNNPGVTA